MHAWKRNQNRRTFLKFTENQTVSSIKHRLELWKRLEKQTWRIDLAVEIRSGEERSMIGSFRDPVISFPLTVSQTGPIQREAAIVSYSGWPKS